MRKLLVGGAVALQIGNPVGATIGAAIGAAVDAAVDAAVGMADGYKLATLMRTAVGTSTIGVAIGTITVPCKGYRYAVG